jgi:zinc transport system ATP-binding protein
LQSNSQPSFELSSREPLDASAADVLLDAHELTVSFEGKKTLDKVDLRISRGEIVTLIGLNGSGKSTLVRTMLGLQQPESGRIYRKPGLRIGYSPQYSQRDPIFPLTVRRFLTLGEKAPRARLEALLEEVGAGTVLHRQLAAISGGELHRVLLARALLRKPDLLALDEPLAGVDVAGQSDLYSLIAGLRDRYDCGVLLVSHDLHVVMAATDRVLCLNHHVCCTGHPESVSQHPEFVSLFGKSMSEVLGVYVHHHDHRHDATGGIVRAPRAAQSAAHNPVDQATTVKLPEDEDGSTMK